MTTDRSLRHAARWCGVAAATMAASMGIALIDTALAAPPVTYTVCASGCDSTTIQGAIDMASAGDTIDVDAGTYNETVTIDKALTVLGVFDGVDPSSSGRGAESIISATYAVIIASNDVVFDGFEISGFRHGVRVTDTFTNIEIGHNWIHDADVNQTQQVGVLLEPALITDVRLINNIIETSDTANSLAAIGLSSCCTATTPTVADLEIIGNSIGVSDYGIYSSADPTAYLVDGLLISGNHFHDTPAAIDLGNVTDGIVTGNVFDSVRATLGIDTGEISGNTFTGGTRLGLRGTDGGSWIPTTNLEIRNNTFTNEVSGRAITIGTGANAATTRIWANAFLDAGIDTGDTSPEMYTGYVVRNTGVGTADMTLNWWDHATGATDHSGTIFGSVDTDPWIASFTDDPAQLPPTDWPLADLALTGPVGFWPLVDTETTITSSTPDPTYVGGSVSTVGTVEITGLGGDTSGITSLSGRVDVTNGTDSCDDTSLAATATNLLFDYSCSFTSSAASSTAISATFKHANGVRFYADSSDQQAHDVFAIENLTITFDGEFFDADGFGTTRLLATIDGGTEMCESGVTVTFTLSPAVGAPIEVTATSALDGSVSTTASLPVGVYEVTVSAVDTEGCIYTDGVGTIVVFNRDAATTGGGWYKVDASPPRVNFGYTVQVKVNRRLDTTTVSGQLLWTHQGTNRLKGAVTGYYVPVECPSVGELTFVKCARFIGTGTLYDYNADTERWVNPRTVTFEVWVADGGQSSLAKRGGSKQSKPDAFGISIDGESIEGEWAPIQLNGGNLQIR